MKKPTKTVLAVILFACLIGGFAFRLGRTQGPSIRQTPRNGINLPFEKVKRFKRSGKLVFLSVAPIQLLSFDLSRDERPRFWGVLDAQSKTPGLSFGSIAACPDGSRFYVGTTDTLLEYSNRFQCLRKIPIAAFNFGQGKYCFSGDAVASDERLWLTVTKILTRPSLSEFSSRNLLVEWRAKDPPQKCIVADVGGFEQMTIDPHGRRAFVPMGCGVVFDFLALKARKMDWGQWGYTYAQFDPGFGLLLSKRCESEKSCIALENIATGQRKVVTEGILADWGFDGLVYFDVGDQLWRCKVDGTNREPVYIPDVGATRTATCVRNKKFSPDRTFLAVNYSVPGFWGKKSGLVLIDLKEGQYKEVPDITVESHLMAWLDPSPGSGSR